jgi:hypothetical protein
MVHRFRAAARGFDKHAEVLAQRRLADKVIKLLRADMTFAEIGFAERRCDRAPI